MKFIVLVYLGSTKGRSNHYSIRPTTAETTKPLFRWIVSSYPARSPGDPQRLCAIWAALRSSHTHCFGGEVLWHLAVPALLEGPAWAKGV